MSARNRQQPSELPEYLNPPSDVEQASEDDATDEEVDDEDAGVEEDVGAVEAVHPERPTVPPPPPSGLKEISSLASWTVSSSKPGCGVSALRAGSTSLFWQSDGPQPHHLNIHFFKLVEIVGMRIYLDFDLDESYTPTMIRFAAGTGYNDLQEFSTMRFEQPRGWVEVDFDSVGEAEASEGDSDDMKDESEEEKENTSKMPVLRCILVQVRICENHQNGKDTHLRGLQIFGRDGKKAQERMSARVSSSVTTNSGAERRKKRVWDTPAWAMVPELR